MTVPPTLALSLFATPVAVFDLPGMEEVNRELAARFTTEAAQVPSWQRANVGGWHSRPDLSQRRDACYQTLIRAIVDQVGALTGAVAADAGIEPLPPFRYGVTAWAMVMRDGHYVALHDHGDAHWSCAYYVDAGDEAPAPSGRLAFVDPRRSGRQIADLPIFGGTFDLAPRTGALVVFPGWLQHYVHAYRGARPRICVSCNLTLEPVGPRV